MNLERTEEISREIPKILYKYRASSNRVVDKLAESFNNSM